MSDFHFDTAVTPYCYIRITNDHGYGHMRAYFQVPSKGASWERREVRFVLDSQLNTYRPEDAFRAYDLYAIRMDLLTCGIENLPEASNLAKRYLKSTEGALSGLSGYAEWKRCFVLACSAFKIKHVYISDSVRDARCIPDMPHFPLGTKSGYPWEVLDALDGANEALRLAMGYAPRSLLAA